MPHRLRLAALITCTMGVLANAQDGPTEPQDEAEIKAAIQSYVQAFNSRDAKKLAAHWSSRSQKFDARHVTIICL